MQTAPRSRSGVAVARPGPSHGPGRADSRKIAPSGDRTERVASWRVALAVIVLASGLAPVAALAQLGHPLVSPEDRPLHERLGLADAVVVGTVSEIRTGRVEIEDARIVRGSLAPRFEIKRSPIDPPPVEVGQRLVLPLRGARSPYLLIDEPIELIRMEAGADEEHWVAALRALDEAAGRPEALREVYLAWSDGDDDGLRTVALRARVAPGFFLAVADEPMVRGRVRVVRDPSASVTVRRAAATVAVRSPDAIHQLLAYLDETGGEVDPQIAAMVLQAGMRLRAEAAQDQLFASLDSGSPELRGVAVRVASLGWTPELAARLETIASEDPDEVIRSNAERALRSVRRRVRPPR